MPAPMGMPPGRAGRIWLHRRLDTAERGRAQLDRKLHVLSSEQQRLRLVADRARTRWVAAVAQARTWLLRATLVGGQDALRLAYPPAPLIADLRWATAMGVRYPAEVHLSAATRAAVAEAAVESNAAVAPAVAAVRAAITAGAQLAAADEAVRRMDAEAALTRRRVRALDKRRLPQLRVTLQRLDLELEQAEQEDAMRLRQAVTGPDEGP